MNNDQRIAELERRVYLLEAELARIHNQQLMLGEARPPREIETILAAVCAEFDVTREQVVCDSRIERYVEARHAAMFLSRTLTNNSMAEIGRVLGNRDHGTVLNGERRCAERLETDPQFRARFTRVREAIKIQAPELLKAS